MDVSTLERHKFVLLSVFAALCVLWAAPVLAQNDSAATPNAPAAYIVVNPQTGFPLDPFFVSMQGGGPVAADSIARGCPGFVTATPSLTVDYKGTAELMRTFFYSDGDAVLIVQSPDGAFKCNDNTNEQLFDPTITLDKPAQGQYNVWVGSRLAKDLVPGVLVFTSRPTTDLGTFSVGNLIKRPQVPAILPMRDRVEGWRIARAAGALTPVPLQLGGSSLTAALKLEGDTPSVELTTGSALCNGLVTLAPDYAFEIPAGAEAVSIYFEGNGDTTLLVRDPSGNFVCADDTDKAANLNPSILLTKPAAGNYLVWVGRLDPTAPVDGTLTISPAADAKPQPFTKP